MINSLTCRYTTIRIEQKKIRWGRSEKWKPQVNRNETRYPAFGKLDAPRRAGRTVFHLITQRTTGPASLQRMCGAAPVRARTGGRRRRSGRDLGECRDLRTRRQFNPGMAMNFARSQHNCTTLNDGRVLVVGGAAPAEIYDAAANAWTVLDSPGLGRRASTATLRPDGTAAIVGGSVDDAPSAIVEIFDPSTNLISTLQTTLSSLRKHHAAAFVAGWKRSDRRRHERLRRVGDHRNHSIPSVRATADKLTRFRPSLARTRRTC